MSARTVTFVLVREGSSDEGLMPHLRALILRGGATEALGQARDFAGTPASKLALLSREAAPTDIVFVHRDADKAGSDVRRSEIARAAASSSLAAVVVPVVPVQELEAWLLTDEAAIRSVVGRPNGVTDLGLPRISAIESTSSPKEILQFALLAASQASGRRRAQEKRDFHKRRRTLLDRLDIDGPVRQLPAWRQLEHDVATAVATLRTSWAPSGRYSRNDSR